MTQSKQFSRNQKPNLENCLKNLAGFLDVLIQIDLANGDKNNKVSDK